MGNSNKFERLNLSDFIFIHKGFIWEKRDGLPLAQVTQWLNSIVDAYNLAIDNGDFSALIAELREGNPWILHPNVQELLASKLEGNFKRQRARPKQEGKDERDRQIVGEVALLVSRGFPAYERTGKKLTACKIVGESFSLGDSSVSKIWDQRDKKKPGPMGLPCLAYKMESERIAYLEWGEEAKAPPYFTTIWRDKAKDLLQREEAATAEEMLIQAKTELAEEIGDFFIMLEETESRIAENLINAALSRFDDKRPDPLQENEVDT